MTLVRPFSFEEDPQSRNQESGDSQSHELVFIANGETDDFIVHNYAIFTAPTAVARPTGILYRTGIRVESIGWALYRVTANYGSRKATPGSYTFNFDTTGATINIKCAKSHIKSYPVDGDWHKGALNVKKDGDVEGADIVIPALKLTYTFKQPQGIVTEDYANQLARVTGTTNLNPYRVYAAGELLFVGGTGSDGSDAEAEVSYQFIASQNVTGISIGGISGIAKNGHDYAWVEFEDDVHSGEAVQRPKRVHVDLIYDSTDFASALGWS